MFKNFVIVLLLVSTLGFGWLALRNATPRGCDELIRAESGNLICLTSLGDVRDNEIQDAVRQIEEQEWKW